MKPFLYRVAETFYRLHGDEIVRFAFVFPNRRSSLFFQHYLAQVAGKPLFSPIIFTVNNLMTELSQLSVVDKTELLFTLYEEYLQLRDTDEPFDRFLFWGEMLAGDFDDVDKYMVDASQLFTNIEDLKDLEKPYLTPEQLEVIRQFWNTYFYPDADSEKKVEFNTLWNILHDLYVRLRTRLLSKGLGYEGMIFREVAEAARNGSLSVPEYKRIVFVGFNAITEAERMLMGYLRDSGQGDFYWDYYAPTLQDKENKAAYFLSLNKKQFPSQYDIGEHIITSMPEMTVIPVSSGVGQAKQAGVLLQKLVQEGHVVPEAALNTAIVLPDEELLMPMLYSVPEDFPTINITMGYSLRNTPVAALFDAIYQLQKHVRWSGGESLFYHLEVTAILNHRFIKVFAGKEASEIIGEINRYNKAYVSAGFMGRSPLLSLIFQTVRTVEEASRYLQSILLYLLKAGYTENSDCDDSTVGMQPVDLSNLEHEYLYHYDTIVKRLGDVMSGHDVTMEVSTYFSLLGKLASNLSVPFNGEPLSGLQIMGVLETRVLDFENIIILSMNEGVFPMKKVAGSFIPYNLRRGFGLATTEHQDSIYAYYFYRMISRAKRVYMLYDSRTDGLKRGEMSRYIYQIKYHYSRLLPAVNISELHISHNVSVEKATVLSIDKTDRVAGRLREFLQGGTRRLSASHINTYLNCPLQFYLQHVEQLCKDDEIKEIVDSGIFGSIYHGVMGEIYDRMKYDNHPVEVTCDMINAVLKDKKFIPDLIKQWFAREFFKIPPEKAGPLRGQNYIIGHVIQQYVCQTLDIDKNFAPFTYVASELRLDDVVLPLQNGLNINFKAFIDRIDCIGDTLRILDYKTGRDELSSPSIESLFDSRMLRRPKAVFQVLLYCKLYKIRYPSETRRLQPVVYKVRDLFGTFSPCISCAKEVIDDYRQVAEAYEEALDRCLTELFDMNTPFTQTEVPEHCQYCDFKTICKR